MADITLTLTDADLVEAVRDWFEKQGFPTSDRFGITTTITRGDRPLDSDMTTVRATGIFAGKQ